MMRFLYFMLGFNVAMSIMTYAITHKMPHSLTGACGLLLLICALENREKVTR